MPASVARGGAAAQVTCHTAAELNIYKPNAVLGTFQFKMGPLSRDSVKESKGVKDVPPKLKAKTGFNKQRARHI